MDLSVYRSEFPITERYIYVNHASVSPLPRRVVGAMNDFAEDVMLNGTAHSSSWSRCYSGLRSAAARLLAAGPDEIFVDFGNDRVQVFSRIGGEGDDVATRVRPRRRKSPTAESLFTLPSPAARLRWARIGSVANAVSSGVIP